MLAANDTALPRLLPGQVFETTAWVVQRKGDHVKVLDVREAGKRGKRAALFVVHDDLDAVVLAACAAAAGGAKLDAMRAALPAAAFETVVPAHKLERPSARVRVESPKVRADFGPRDFRITFVATSTLRGKAVTVDTTVHQASVRDAAKALAWARDNAEALTQMGHIEACEALRAAGIRAA